MKGNARKALWISLGLLMLIPGLGKLFIMKPAAIEGMLSGIVLFAWAPLFWAWVLILSEIGFGALILARYKLELTTIPPIIIISVAMLFVVINWGSFMETSMPTLFFHLVAISGYWMLGSEEK